uniref:Shisa N-terminal domain-containing protein n=1 Tax=Dicentrarchus labrax TaxID=13489 RepID=A0A8C4GNN2_DICLA
MFKIFRTFSVISDYCSSYWDTDGQYHDDQQCSQYCCGNCNQKYCCNENKYRLTQGKQDRCSGRCASLSMIQRLRHVQDIIGSLFSNQTQSLTLPSAVATIVNLPQQPTSPSGYQPSYPGYQPVPVQPGYVGPPIPTAPPPSYMEASKLSHTIYKC